MMEQQLLVSERVQQQILQRVSETELRAGLEQYAGMLPCWGWLVGESPRTSTISHETLSLSWDGQHPVALVRILDTPEGERLQRILRVRAGIPGALPPALSLRGVYLEQGLRIDGVDIDLSGEWER